MDFHLNETSNKICGHLRWLGLCCPKNYFEVDVVLYIEREEVLVAMHVYQVGCLGSMNTN
jgi:hypothetical protein